jgi:hypothetical protein
MVLAPTACTRAASVASSGFNDVTGINGDGILNNRPFDISGASLQGQGIGELGWAGPWQVSNPGIGFVNNAFTDEGDGAAAFFNNTAVASRILSTPQTGVLNVSVAVMAPGAITRDVLFRVMDSSIPKIFQAIGVQWQVNSDRDFYVLDGTGNSAPTGEANLLNTGFVLPPGVWADVDVTINFPAQTWTFAVDGARYQSPTPLSFRGQPSVLDEIQYVNEISVPNGSYLDAVVIQTVPAPASAILFGLGSLAVAAVAGPKPRPRLARRVNDPPSGNLGAGGGRPRRWTRSTTGNAERHEGKDES